MEDDDNEVADGWLLDDDEADAIAAAIIADLDRDDEGEVRQ